ncbi:MAG: inorganic phosphate transporter [Candidatus Micrarchaeota archaeon]|nr:inorganic phosphate transporter [Candidatus Micrarchaeota archaeon]
MYELILLLLGAVLLALVSGNNLAVCMGNAISGRLISRRNGIALTIIGYVAGMVLEKGFFSKTLSFLLPKAGPLFVGIALAIPIALFVLSYVRRVPQSLSIIFTMSLIGIGLASHEAVDLQVVALIVMFWIFVPLASFVLMVLLMRATSRALRNKFSWRKLRLLKMLVILSSFFVSFTLGANTLGFIYNLLPSTQYTLPVITLSIALGAALLSGSVLRRTGTDIMAIRYLNAFSSQAISVIFVEFATIFGVPISNSQTFVSSIYGAAISYRSRLILKKPFFAIIYSWTSAAIVSIIAGYLAASLLA